MSNTKYTALLDAWMPPLKPNAEPPVPISFVTTTFTFNSSFFEDNCLYNFLQLNSDKEDNDSIAYKIEQLDKLSQLHSGLLLVDYSCLNGKRLPYLDVAAIHVPNGILHAKISLLYWDNCIRLIIASANLTEDGYCRNQEIFAVLDINSIDASHKPAIIESIAFIDSIMQLQNGEHITTKWQEQKTLLVNALNNWNTNKTDLFKSYFLVLKKANQNVFDIIRANDKFAITNTLDSVHVTSPFWDDANNDQNVMQQLRNTFCTKNTAIHLNALYTPAIIETDSKPYLAIPEWMASMPKAHVILNGIEAFDNEMIEDAKSKRSRPLHQKTLWLRKGTKHAYMIGSSNFTSAGYGCNSRNNFEANIMYIVDEKKDKASYKSLCDGYLEPLHCNIKSNTITLKPTEINTDEVSPNVLAPLPKYILQAILYFENKKYKIVITHTDEKAISNCVFFGVNPLENHNAKPLQHQIESKIVQIVLQEGIFFDHLIVKDLKSNKLFYLPILLHNKEIVPFAQLKNLPIEVLMQIMMSKKPLYTFAKQIQQALNNKTESDDTTKAVINPLQQIDTSTFMLQRTRKYFYLFTAIANKLAMPCYSIEGLQWRLTGPIGVQVFAEAITHAELPASERYFLLAELYYTLDTINYKVYETGLPNKIFTATMQKFLKVFKKKYFIEQVKDIAPAIQKYCNAIIHNNE